MARQTEIEKLERRYEEKPSQWFAALAEEYRRAGDVDLALDIVRKGLEQRSTYVSGHVVLARCLLQQNNDGEAEQVLKQVLELDSENIIALKVLSEIKERANDTAAALEWLKRLLEVDPMNQEAQESVERLRSPVPAEVDAGPPDEGLAPDEPQDAVATEKMTAVELEEAGLADTAPPEEGEQAVPAGVAGVETGSPGEVSVLETIPAVPSDPVGEAVAVPEGGGVGAPAEPPSADLAAPESAPAEPGPLPVQAVPEAAPTVPEPAAVAASEPEPVVTETIADVYFSQGLYAEARVVYQQLLEQRPDDASLQAKLADLEGKETSVERPESAPVQVFAARETGGLSARAFVTGVLAATVGTPSYQAPPDHVSSGEASPAETAPTLPEEPSPLEAAFEAPEPAGLEVPGEPTQPATDSPSLAAVFDETPGVSGGPSSPSPPDAEQPDGEPAAKDGEMSFDEFFGDGESQEPAGETSEPTADQADDVREDQDFKDWLKGLKS